MSHSFSIIVCTYNPDPIILQRLLAALEAIAATAGNPDYEIIIVDNNSRQPVAERADVQAFRAALPQARFIVEVKPGLTSARIAGISAAQKEWVIFFDDDNEPAADYLLQAQQVILQYPQAGIWGPGKVQVEFIGKVEPFAHAHKDLFQERNMSGTVIDNVRWGQDAYPYGTGMVVRKNILDRYLALVAQGRYTMSDRIGKSLISGGDIQILLTGIQMGYYGGSTPQLQLRHLIKQEKTAYKKMLQLVFMLSASAIKTYNQVFTDAPFEVVPISNKYVLRTIYSQARMHFLKKPWKEFVFLMTKRVGELQAHILAADLPQSPWLLRWYQKAIH